MSSGLTAGPASALAQAREARAPVPDAARRLMLAFHRELLTGAAPAAALACAREGTKTKTHGFIRLGPGQVSDTALPTLPGIAIARGDPARGVHMNARTLIITAGALVALAAPAVASAKLSPAAEYQKSLAAKTHSATHAKQVFKRQGKSRKIYKYYPAPGLPQEKSLAEIQAGYNLELIDHALAAIQFPDTSTAPATSDDASAAATSDNSSTSTTSDATQTSDSTPAADASFAAAPAMSTAAVDGSEDC